MIINKSSCICRELNLLLTTTCWFVLTISASVSAQEPKPPSTAEVRALIKRSLNKEVKVSDEANQALSKLDAKALPAVIEILKSGKTCERLEAAKVLLDIDPKNKSAIPVLVSLAKGRTIFSSEDDLMCRRAAAFLLAFYPEGIEKLVEFLRDKDIFVRRSAVFAFDDLTETGNYPEGSIQAMKAAILILAETMKDQDEILSEMAGEVLGQIMRGGDEELSKAAKRQQSRRP